MRTIGLFKDWYYEHSDKIGIIAALVLALALIFPLDKFLVSLLGLSGTTKYVIITLIDILIFIPIVILIISNFIVLRDEIGRVWEQLMSDGNSVWNSLLSFIRHNAMIFVLVLVYVLFYRFWESWIGNYIVDPFLSYFESNLLNDIIFFIALIVCLVLVYYNIYNYFKERIIKRHSLIIAIIAMIIWAYYRFHHGLCGMNDSPYYLYLTPLSILKPIKYFDIVFVFAVFEYLSYFLGKWNDSNIFGPNFDKTRGLTRNLPISNKDDDFLGRDEFAESVVKDLLITDTSNSSFTCGIDAPWGSGKTSFICLMKNHLRFDSVIIDFNPWSYTAQKDLVTAFFDELSKTLKHYDKSLAKNLIEYSKLLSTFNTTETKIISTFWELTHHDENSLKEKKQQISDAIKRIRRRIIVFIDDLDRLEADEILEMMKLIRNVSDFPYMYIIAAYDKSYIVKCLYTKMKSGAANFIEKIFEQEYILAPCSNESLRQALVDQLCKLGNGSFIKPELKDYIMDHNNKALNALSNLREIYKLSNDIASTYSLINPASFNKIDILLFALFKTKYPVAFSLFEHRWHEILVSRGSDKHQYYELFHGMDYDGHFDFIKYLDSHQEEMCLNEFEIKTIKMILSALFKYRENDHDEAHRINNVRWFNRYLNLTQLKSDITEKEFNKVMTEPFDKITQTFDDWLVDKSESLKHRLLNYDKSTKLEREQLIIRIQGVFYVSIKDNWENYAELTDMISQLPRFNDDKFSENDHSFIMGQLKDNGFSNFTCSYIGYLYKEKEYSAISLNEEELINLQESIFNASCKMFSENFQKYPDIDDIYDTHPILKTFCCLLGEQDIQSVFNNIKVPYDKYTEKLTTLMQNHVREYPVFFLKNIVRPLWLGMSRGVGYMILPIAYIIWGSWDLFKKYLSELKESDPIIEEFKVFFNAYEKNHFKPVEYTFRTFIPQIAH